MRVLQDDGEVAELGEVRSTATGRLNFGAEIKSGTATYSMMMRGGVVIETLPRTNPHQSGQGVGRKRRISEVTLLTEGKGTLTVNGQTMILGSRQERRIRGLLGYSLEPQVTIKTDGREQAKVLSVGVKI